MSEISKHSTCSSVTIVCENYFDVGTDIPTYNLKIPSSRLANYGDKLIKVFGPLLWNSIPYNIQDACSVQTFKFYMKRYFLDRYKLAS